MPRQVALIVTGDGSHAEAMFDRLERRAERFNAKMEKLGRMFGDFSKADVKAIEAVTREQVKAAASVERETLKAANRTSIEQMKIAERTARERSRAEER